MVKRALLPLFLVAVFVLSACGSPGQASTLKIGLEAPLTGDYATEGKGFENALKLLVEQTNAAGGINGQKVELFVEDDKGDPKEASLVADRLVSKKVIAVIGAYNSSATEPASAVYNREGILHITPSSTATRLTTKGYQRFFRVCFLDDRQGLFAADFMSKVMGYKNVGILHDNSTYAQGLAEWAKKYLEERNVKVGFYDAINPKDNDFSPTLTKIKGSGVEAVYFTGYYAQGGLLLKQAPAVGLKIQWLGGDAMNNPDLIKIAGPDNAKSFIVTTAPLPSDLDYPEAKTFLADYKAKYGNEATSVYTLFTADTFRVIKYAIEQTKSTDPKKLAAYLHNDFKGMAGITGPVLGFDQNGDRKGTIHKAYVVDDKGNFAVYPKQP